MVNQIGNSNQKLIYKIYLRQGETAQAVSNRKIKKIKKKKRGEKQNNNACSVGWMRLVTGARPGGLLTFVHYYLSPDASNEKDQ